MAKPARIRSRSPNSVQALRIVQTDKGVFWDIEDTESHTRRFIISTKPKSTRKLAQWILDNIADEVSETRESDG